MTQWECDRCGAFAPVNWVDVTTFGDLPGSRRMANGAVCPTPDCVDDHGSSAVDPPDQPGQLTRDDRRWLRRQRHLADELGLTASLLDAATKGW